MSIELIDPSNLPNAAFWRENLFRAFSSRWNEGCLSMWSARCFFLGGENAIKKEIRIGKGCGARLRVRPSVFRLRRSW
ncbi:hypothetical protein EON65_21735 [archaeon]|nr:MAG: hypothetical protein EON65_21735 [archaeon]